MDSLLDASFFEIFWLVFQITCAHVMIKSLAGLILTGLAACSKRI